MLRKVPLLLILLFLVVFLLHTPPPPSSSTDTGTTTHYFTTRFLLLQHPVVHCCPATSSCSWNSRVPVGRNAPGKIDVLIDECDRYKLDLVALTELHWPGQGRSRHKNWEIIHSGPDTSRKEKTVGLLLSHTAAKSLLSYECISDRLLIARFNCKHVKLTIVVCYAPTNSETRPGDTANKDAFYNQLDDVVSNIPKHDIQLVVGDMNAQLGDDVNTWKPALGCHARADVGGDHNLAITTVRLSLAVLKQQKKQLKFNSSNLSNRDILASFNATIGGKFNILAELDDTSDINEEWANFTDTVNSAAREHLGYRKGKQEEWISSESRDLISRRKRAKPSLGSDYQELNRQTRASLRNDKKAWYSKIADDLESAARSNNMREVYQMKNILIGKTSRRASQIRDVNGNIIKDEAARLQRWSEYFKGLLKSDEPEETIDFSVFTQAEELNINMDPPVREEVDKALGLLKRNKAPGVDNITPEILKDGGDVIREWLLRICQHVWKNEVTPAEWGKGIILPLPKKETSPTVVTTEASPLLTSLEKCFQPFYSRE
ncbi:uncharacterized protein [Amphiura filiformis]|uniref:uncharacterized protein n=1 Tax=Amphiura filiformis TaxID=82378 RepID=UPI003B2159DE